MAVENLVELVKSLTPAEQDAVMEFVDFLKRKESRTSSTFVTAADEFIAQHPELLRRLAQ